MYYVETPAIASIIDVMKTTVWGESGFPARFLGSTIVLLLGLLLATTVMGQERNDDEPVDLDEIQEDVVRDLFDENGWVLDPDQRLARIAQENEGGFGGYYFHNTDKSTVYVYMLAPTQTESAEDAFLAAYRGKHQVTQIIPVQGDYAFDNLLEWFYTLDKAMVADGIHPSTGAVLEIANRIHFGLEDIEQAEDAREIMEDLEIPEDAVIFEESHPQLLADKDTVKAKWRPVVGGTQHNIRYT